MEEQEFLKYVSETVRWILMGKKPGELTEEFKQRIGELTREQHKGLFFTAMMASSFDKSFLKMSKDQVFAFKNVFDEGYDLALYHEKCAQDEEPLFVIKVPEPLRKSDFMQTEFSKHMIDASKKIISENKDLGNEEIQDLLNEYGEKVAHHFEGESNKI